RNVRLLSRNRLPLNASYPAVADAIAELPVRDAVFDGEATGVWGKAGKVAYHVLDILWLDGRDGMSLPLDQRRALCNRLPLRARLDRLEIPAPPFTKAVGLPRKGAHWVQPEIVVQVAFIEWTVHGKLRHPRLLGIRIDKAPREVTRENP